MRFDNILQIIVPLTFLAIWALTSLFNRDAQPLPPRTNNRKPPLGPPGMRPPANRPPERRPELSSREPATRWQPASTQTRQTPKRPGNSSDADIVILETDSHRPLSSPPRPGPGMIPRRGSRSRSTPTAPTPPKSEPATPRSLSASMSHESSPLGLTASDMLPLGRIKSTLGVPEEHEITKVSRPSSQQSPQTTSLVFTIGSEPLSLAKIREAIVINELLAPPVALRRRETRTRQF